MSAIRKASPRPWRESDRSSNLIVDDSGNPVATNPRGGTLDSYTEQGQANLRHIVRAVNAHDALVAALRECVSAIETTAARREMWSSGDWSKVVANTREVLARVDQP